MFLQAPVLAQGAEPVGLLFAEPSGGAVTVSKLALDIHVDIIVGGQPDIHGLARHFRCRHDAVAQEINGTRTDQLVERTLFAPAACRGEQGVECVLDQAGIVDGIKALDVLDGGGELHAGKIDAEPDLRLLEGAVTLAEDANEQQQHKRQRQQDGRQPVQPEAPLRGVAASQFALHPLSRALPGDVPVALVSHIAPGSVVPRAVQ